MYTPPQSQRETDRSRLESLRPLRTRGRATTHIRAGDAVADSSTRAGSADVTIAVERSAVGCLLRVAGELDGNTCLLLEALLEHIGDDPCGRIELDLSGVSFADPPGLRPALSSNTMIKTASPAVRSTLRSLANTRAAPE